MRDVLEKISEALSLVRWVAVLPAAVGIFLLIGAVMSDLSDNVVLAGGFLSVTLAILSLDDR